MVRDMEKYMKSKILKLEPFYSKKIWGYEQWLLSTHKNGKSRIENIDIDFSKYIGKELPIIKKIIKANSALSVQVHPDNKYSKENENENGKTECWYILEADENATLICGIKDGHNKQSFFEVIKKDLLELNLESISVKSGDVIYIPAGTVHAINGGIKLLEIQQNSDITYRIYDWGRDREMHIDKALEVIDYEKKNKCGKISNFSKLETPYFTIEKVIVNDLYNDKVKKDFYVYTVINGDGYISDGYENIKLNKEDTVYIEHNTRYKIFGKLELIKSYV